MLTLQAKTLNEFDKSHTNCTHITYNYFRYFQLLSPANHYVREPVQEYDGIEPSAFSLIIQCSYSVHKFLDLLTTYGGRRSPSAVPANIMYIHCLEWFKTLSEYLTPRRKIHFNLDPGTWVIRHVGLVIIHNILGDRF